ncbi:hypothetical protein [Microbacterium sp. H6]|uniref:hypothetical protein n=1 Tax=Microbacterium sp. H6 TaxID=421122 RepID=UPI000DE474BB|nr:hypothetical protein [Microbacterium sp. H6]RBO73522.1 hypothetical protein DSP71_05030 [Microbacterium sp. H6]
MSFLRFRVATRASGVRRQVWVHVYDDREEMARAHQKHRGHEYRTENDIAGGVVHDGFRWPKPDPTPLVVMRLWTGQLTTRTVAHESTHAAAAFYFMDCVPGWDSRARTFLLGNHEPLAYLIGDLTSEVIAALYRLELLH